MSGSQSVLTDLYCDNRDVEVVIIVNASDKKLV